MDEKKLSPIFFNSRASLSKLEEQFHEKAEQLEQQHRQELEQVQNSCQEKLEKIQVHFILLYWEVFSADLQLVTLDMTNTLTSLLVHETNKLG